MSKEELAIYVGEHIDRLNSSIDDEDVKDVLIDFLYDLKDYLTTTNHKEGGFK